VTADGPIGLAGAGEPSAAEGTALEAYGDMPLSFIPNRGQIDSQAAFYAQGAGYGMYFTPGSALLSFTEGASQNGTLPAAPTSGVNLALEFMNSSSDVRLGAGEPEEGTVNYFQGNEPSDWQSGLPTFGEVTYQELWPGIDLAFRGAGGELKYEFILEPGARVDDIRLRYAGADGVSLKPNGELAINTALGTLTDSSPVTYQEIAGQRVPVQSRFVLGEAGSYRFAVGDYEPGNRLVIDPGLAYSSYLGSEGIDEGFGVAVDASGSAYVTGYTGGAHFPTTIGAFDQTANINFDAFVTKLNPTGSAPLAYSTYLGGNGHDEPHGIAVDTTGSAYVTGLTSSTSFPTTLGAFDRTFGGGNSDAFVTKLNPAGSSLLYSTYLGGSSGEQGYAIALDTFGSAYVTGLTGSLNFPTTLGAFDTAHSGGADAFVTKLSPAGSAPLGYSTFLGGTGDDRGFGIAVDLSGNSYLTGQTNSGTFPTTPGAFDTTHNGDIDAFVTKLDAVGSAPLAYSTYLGGGGRDEGHAIAIDTAGNSFVSGITTSPGFPTTLAAFDTTYNGSSDAFVTKLDAVGSAPLAYSTYLGGSGGEQGSGIALDASGSAHVTGGTTSTNFPTTPGAYDIALGGGGDAFVTKLNPAGSAPLAYSTYLGGPEGERANAIAVDPSGAYITGLTAGTFPTTPGAPDMFFSHGFSDAFVTKLDLIAGALPPATTELTPPTATNPVGSQHTVTAKVEDVLGNTLPDVVVQFSVTGSVTDSGSCATDADGQCDFTYQGPELPGSDTITAFADTDEDGVQDLGEPSGAATNSWVLPPSTAGCDVTDSGKVTDANGDTAIFSGNAHVSADATGVTGQQQYKTLGAAKMTVQSIAVLALSCSPDRTEAEIFGTATVDGAGSFDFRIDVEDNGNPGQGNDLYEIELSNGYSSGLQVLEGGNIQIS
jgi:hypothetical protein